MTEQNAGAAAPVGTTSAPAGASAGATGNTAANSGNGASAGGAQQGSGGQQAAIGGQQPPAGQTAPVDGVKAPDGQQQPSVDFKIPDAYKDKPWASKVKSIDDVYKQLDNLDSLAGKKAIIPDLKTATPEQKEAFYAQLRGKDANEYVIPDNPAFPTTPETKTAVTEMFMKNGISPVQANEITKSYQEFGAKMMAEQFDPEGMKTQLTEAFGKDWEAITRQTRNTIKGMMTPADQAMLDKMPNNYLAPIYRTLGNVIQKYGIRETDAAHFTGAVGSAVAGDMVQQRALIRGELNKLGDQPHTIDQANALRQKLADTYKNDPRIQGR